ncbi:MAG: GGDEF domain-containing protein [Gammaproteobacteria bacterium]|nr:GGDEF domain-containing protein [Gammaproteobacteria bacterium]
MIDACLKQGRKRNLTATLALLQLENFYEIRSWVGLSEADLLLTDIAQLLKTTLPKHVLLCRCHNFEFAVLLIADCSVNARLITDKLKQALLSAVSPSLPRQLELKCGVGLAKLETNIPSWPVVFARARHNLSLAHHHRELPAHLVSISPDIALKQLHAALKCTELKLEFQALVGLAPSPLQHYEVRCSLARHEQSLPTLLLFETAARNALGELLDRRIIEQIMRRLSADTAPNRRLLVNLSHNSLVSIPFLRWLEESLSERRAFASQLIFQISETDALIAQHHLITFCEVIEKLGCKLSLSNFGCTPKPLRYLSLVPASFVKLDTSLLRKLDVNLANLEFLSSLIEQLHKRGISVIAPMLERLPILPLLWKANVDFMQGNCLHPPSPAMNFEFIETRTIYLDVAK